MPEGKFLNDDVYQGKSAEKSSLVESGSFSSTCLSGYKYDHVSKELTLTFTDGTVDTWYDQSKEIVEGLKKASSKGKYFNAVIRIG